MKHPDENIMRKAIKLAEVKYKEGGHAAIWARMKGIVYGASREDQTKEYSWRVNIPASEIISRSTPKLELYPEFMRDECKELLKLKA